MYLISLMALPLLIGLLSLAFSKGRVKWYEMLVMEVAVLVVLGLGYLLATYRSTADVEIRSSRIASKASEKVSCGHSYSCNCITTCSGSGSNQSCTTICQTCYEHSFDVEWPVYTAIGERIEIATVDRQGLAMPPRWGRAFVGEPTARAYDYTNYIKANPSSIFNRIGVKEEFKAWLPTYPNRIYDYYRVDRFFSEGYNDRDRAEWLWLINELNGDLGSKKQVNLIVGLIKNPDSRYQYALEEAWLGGKKNDVVVLIGVPDYPRINWVRVVSWTKAEDFKVYTRDAIMDLKDIRRRDEVMGVIRGNIEKYYVRRPMDDFKYLAASVQPGPTGTFVLFFLGMAVCLWLTYYFYVEDPFDSGRNYYQRSYHY